jgi:hypothetical protein
MQEHGMTTTDTPRASPSSTIAAVVRVLAPAAPASWMVILSALILSLLMLSVLLTPACSSVQIGEANIHDADGEDFDPDAEHRRELAREQEVRDRALRAEARLDADADAVETIEGPAKRRAPRRRADHNRAVTKPPPKRKTHSPRRQAAVTTPPSAGASRPSPLADPRGGRPLAQRWRHGHKGDDRLEPLLDEAIAAASDVGRRVLQTGKRMTLEDPVIMQGSCWTFAAAVYREAGLKRRRIFKTGRDGPWADLDLIEPGDFLSYINHSYNESVHSAIFVRWLDKSRAEALMMSYVGGKRRRPGGFRSYVIDNVYWVQRGR